MRILGFDLGTKTGWVVADTQTGDVVSCGTWKLRNDPTDMGVRYVGFEERLRGILMSGDVVAYEIVCRHRGTQAAHIYGGLQAILMMTAHRMDLQVIPVTVQDVKSMATGNPNAGKWDVRMAAESRGYDLKCQDGTWGEDAADACFIALCAMSPLID